MEYSTIDLHLCDGVATIRLNRPTTLNAVSVEMLEELDDALDVAIRECRAIILGANGSSFCSGGDLSGGLTVGMDADGADFGAVLGSHINPLMTRLRALPIPWVTAVRGSAAGFGCALALAGDMVIASETARFLQAFARIGLVPDGGATPILVRGAGRVRAMEAMLLAEPIPAATALDWGIVNRVVSDDQLDEAARAIATRFAAGPTRTLGLIRNAVWAAVDRDWDAALCSERIDQRTAGRTHDAQEGIAAFVMKRPATFAGR